MDGVAFQDFYPDELAVCYGCGRLNEHGLKVRSFWDGEEAVAFYTPRPWQMAFPGVVYGGLIASVIDCHCIGTASAAAYRAEGREMGSDPPLRYVTASIQVDYLKPTPLGPPLEVRARVVELAGRKAVLTAEAIVEGAVRARGKVIGVRISEHILEGIREEFSHDPPPPRLRRT